MHFDYGGWIILNPPPTQIPFDADGQPSRAWTEYLQQVNRTLKYKGTDTTANRPTDGLNDGDSYIDTTLGQPIWYYSGGWIDATGASV